MRYFFLSLVALVVGLLGQPVLERYMNAAPEMAWRVLALVLVLAGVTGAVLSDPVFALWHSHNSSRLGAVLVFTIAFGCVGAAIGYFIPKRVANAIAWYVTMSLAEHQRSARISGIRWSPKYSELTVRIINQSDDPLEDIDVWIRPDVAVASIAQATSRPNVMFSVHGLESARVELRDMTSGHSTALPLVLIATTAGYHMKLDRIPGRETLATTIAMVSMDGGQTGTGAVDDSRSVLRQSSSTFGDYWFGYGNDAVFGPRPVAKSVRLEASYTRASVRTSQTDDIKPMDLVSDMPLIAPARK